MRRTYLSWGDIIDFYLKIKQKGLHAIMSHFNFSNKSRIISKWNKITFSSSFWIIPEMRQRWNYKCTGNPNLKYEDYFVLKYLQNRSNLCLLSIGCGEGSHERNFAQYPIFSIIEGIDIASNQIREATKLAMNENLHNIKYHVGDFINYPFLSEKFDVVLFNSSLHHFSNINTLLKSKVSPMLKKDGFLLVFEYVGPNRLQWTSLQLKNANSILKTIPLKYKYREGTNFVKSRIFRPGLLRMIMVDPSEAINSESILPSLHENFKVIEEKQLGGDILHILLKDIAHNFLKDDSETKELLNYLTEREDEYLNATRRSDFIFGIYQKM